MTPEEITELARQAGFKPDCPTVRLAFYGFDIKQFANLVRNAALDEAAVKCDENYKEYGNIAAQFCAADVRKLKS
jgi:hypothetical protein